MRFCLTTLLFTNILFAISNEAKIIKLIFTSLFDRDVIVYSDSEKKLSVLEEADLNIVKSCKRADIAYISKVLKECEGKPIFSDNYNTFQKEKSVIGAFYWHKGRPNILFFKPRLEDFELKLPKKLEKYEVDEL